MGRERLMLTKGADIVVDRGRTLRGGEERRLMGEKEKQTEERNQPSTNH